MMNLLTGLVLGIAVGFAIFYFRDKHIQGNREQLYDNLTKANKALKLQKAECESKVTQVSTALTHERQLREGQKIQIDKLKSELSELNRLWEQVHPRWQKSARKRVKKLIKQGSDEDAWWPDSEE